MNNRIISKEMSFEEAVKNFDKNKHDGIGFMLKKGDGLCCVTFIDCFINKKIKPETREVLNMLKSYSYISHDGKDVLVIIKAKVSDSPCASHYKGEYANNQFVKILDAGFIEITGNVLMEYGLDIKERQSEFDTFVKCGREYLLSKNPEMRCEVIYLAGEMDKNADRSRIADWRKNIIDATKNAFDANVVYIRDVDACGGMFDDEVVDSQKKDNTIIFLCPEGVGNDHKGLDPEETLYSDMRCIINSTLTYAYLNRLELYGTLTEIMATISSWHNLIIKVNPDLNNDEVSKNTLTNHVDDGVTWREHWNPYWFLLYYIDKYYYEGVKTEKMKFERDVKKIVYEYDYEHKALFEYLESKGFTHSQEYFDSIKQEELENNQFQQDIESLLALEDSEYVKTIITQKYKRNHKMIAELKAKYKQCQLCGFTFKKKNGEPYNESHHIIPLSKNGIDKEINTIIVCANCHKRLHFADVSLDNYFNNEIIINGESFKVNR